MKAYGSMGMKIYTNELGHVINMAAHIWKKIKVFSRTYACKETWYVASGSQVPPRLFV